jgi:chloramphenicol-sensitive protein RarD
VRQTVLGLAAGLAAFLTWGLLPFYWKALADVTAREILCHRMVWSFVFVGLILTLQGRWRELVGSISRQNLLYFSGTSLLLSVNWLTYIWGVNAGYVLEASMGYYINPLVNVLLGFIFFRDRLRPMQLAAIGLAAAGVLNLVINYGRFPWIALTLAFTFGFYGLIRKVVRVESLPGLFYETTIMSGPALAYLLFLNSSGELRFLELSPGTDLLLAGAGVATSFPLLMFAFSARRLRLVEVGIMQYLAPTCMFVLGAFVFQEPFTPVHLLSFLLIWSGVAVYVLELVWHFRAALPRGLGNKTSR